MVRKACSTFVAFFAEVSRKGIESWSANSYVFVAMNDHGNSMSDKLWTDLCNAIFHDFLAGKVGLVANKQLVHTLRSIAVDFLQPLLHVGECIYERVKGEAADGQSQEN